MSEKNLSLMVYGLDHQEFRVLPADQQAVVALLNYVVSEVNALRRIFLSQRLELTGLRAVDSALKIQHFVIFRTWSSKVFEALEALDVLFNHPKKKSKDVVVLKLAENLRFRLQELRQNEGFKVAKYVRHEAANHYSFDAAANNLCHLREDADIRLYTHDHGGNDYYPLGEEVMFQGRLNRKWANLKDKKERDAKFQEWLNWALEATDLLQSANAQICNKLLFENSIGSGWCAENYRVPSELIGHPASNKSPVFWEKLEK